MLNFRLYFDKDRETQWLNEKAAQGWAMTGFSMGFYTFEPSTPGKYTYQIDFADSFGHTSEDYREFMKENGIEIVQSWGYWVILRKEAADGPFELYSDVDSMIEHYSKILVMFKAVTILEMLCLMMVTLSAADMASEPALWFGVILLSVLVATFVRNTFRTKNTIRQLKFRKTGIEEPTNRNVSPILPIGLLCNAVALCLRERVSEPMYIVIEIFAIVLMLTGIAQNAKYLKEQKDEQ